MIVPGSANSLLLAQGASTGYNLTKSLRFRSSASAYMNRTFGSGNAQKYTWSAWVKRGTLGSYQTLINGYTSTNVDEMIRFYNDDTFELEYYNGGFIYQLKTTQVFRDPSAWYHLMVAYDTTQATAANRIKVYVNGSQVTAFSTATYPSQNANLTMNNAIAHYIGVDANNGLNSYFDGYMAEVNFIDGQQLTPSSFGENNATTGVWQPKKYTGTYGSQGYYLPFTDVATTSGSNAGLGKDFSGNGNYWTTNNISVTSGSTYDSMTDVPTLTSATTANYAVLNPINSTATISYANLQWNSNGNLGASSTIAPNSGKWYAEFTFSAINSSVVTFGVSNLLTSSAFSGATQTWQLGYSSAGKLENAGSQTTVATYTTGDVIAVAFDCSTGAATFYKNNTSVGTITNAAFANVPVMLGLGSGGTPSGTSTGYANFGQQPFAYTPPTGYVALNTYNLPTSTIVKGNTVMDATLWTGNGSTQSIVNTAGFKPDFVWTKSRSAAEWHILGDSVRGINKSLFTNRTDAEYADGYTAFNSNGFSVNSWAGTNGSGNTYVGWQWQAGQGTTSSNTNGSITSTVSVNPTAGFSVVTYTGTGANATVGHGLGVSPAFIIVKSRSSGLWNWGVWHKDLSGSTPLLSINNTNAVTNAYNAFRSSSMSSTAIGIGDEVTTNQSGGTYVAYCWAQIAGFSQFGSYTGNGSSDGVFVYTGFQPKFILIKNTANVGADWIIWDATRSPYNASTSVLFPDTAGAEVTTSTVAIDFVSNGFKIRATDGGVNGNGNTLIYACFASNPFKNSLAR